MVQRCPPLGRHRAAVDGGSIAGPEPDASEPAGIAGGRHRGMPGIVRNGAPRLPTAPAGRQAARSHPRVGSTAQGAGRRARRARRTRAGMGTPATISRRIPRSRRAWASRDLATAALRRGAVRGRDRAVLRAAPAAQSGGPRADRARCVGAGGSGAARVRGAVGVRPSAGAPRSPPNVADLHRQGRATRCRAIAKRFKVTVDQLLAANKAHQEPEQDRRGRHDHHPDAHAKRDRRRRTRRPT